MYSIGVVYGIMNTFFEQFGYIGETSSYGKSGFWRLSGAGGEHGIV